MDNTYDNYPYKEKAKNDARRADFGVRLGAYLLDTVFLTLIFLVVFMILLAIAFVPLMGWFEGLDPNTVTEDEIMLVFLPLQCAAYAISFIVSFVYYCMIPARWDGQTPGKRILNIRIVPTDGGENTLRRMFLRNLLGYYISGYVFYVGFLWMLWDDDKESWHDKIAKTTVIHT